MIALTSKHKRGNKFVDEAGNHHGRLVILSLIGADKFKKIQWLCRCDCGNEISVRGSDLRKGKTKSCGCLRKEFLEKGHPLPRGEASFNSLYYNIQRGARKRNYKCSLTKSQVRDIVTANCHYCGSIPNQKHNPGSCSGDFIFNGIDRVDNRIGYIEGNAVPCCKHCNFAKHSRGVEEFKSWIAQVYKHFVEGQSE